MSYRGPRQFYPALQLAVLLLALGVVSATRAQERRLEEIVVVARKREAPLSDVPLSVSVLTGTDLQDSGAGDVFDVETLTPHLDVNQNAGPLNTSFRIRRIGNEPNIVNFEPAVGLFVDGAFRTRTGIASGDLFDVDRIEILRGPQTTLYGKNTTAGVVSILTRRPTRTPEAYSELTRGVIEGATAAPMTRVEGAISGPLTKSLLGRVSGVWHRHDDTMRNLFNGRDSQNMRRYSWRAQLMLLPDSNVETRLVVGQYRIDSARTGDMILNEGIAITGINAAFGVPCPGHEPDERLFCANKPSTVDLDANDATLIFRYDARGHRLTAISGYEGFDMWRDFDVDQLNIQLVNGVDRQDSNSFSQEVRFESAPGQALEWMAGGYFYRNTFTRGDPQEPTFVLGPAASSIEIAPGIPFGQPGDSGFVWSRSNSEHVSVFGDVTWPIREKFHLTTAARWQREIKHTTIDNTTDHTRPTILTLSVLPEAANARLSRQTEAVSWALSGQYRWTDAVMSYLSVARGFKSGGFNGGFGNTLPEDREFGDERVTSIEIGTKAMLFGERLRLNASIFSARYDGYQSAGWVSLRFLVNNAERVSVSGFELDSQAVLGDSLTASLSMSYADSRYDRYTGGGCYFGREPDNEDGTACVLTGRTLPLAPKLRTASTVEYDRPIRLGTFFARLDWAWVDNYNTSATLDPRHVQGAYRTINFRAGWRSNVYELAAWVRNAGDETIVMQEGPSNLFAGDPAYGRFLAAPRIYGVTLRARW